MKADGGGGRSERMRKKWLVRRVVEFLGIWVAIYFIGVQYISPVERGAGGGGGSEESEREIKRGERGREGTK